MYTLEPCKGYEKLYFIEKINIFLSKFIEKIFFSSFVTTPSWPQKKTSHL